MPLVLVATGGGGIAAALWTATILGDLADTSQLLALYGMLPSDTLRR